MEKKLPGIYANKIEKKIPTNKHVYYSSVEQEQQTQLESKKENRISLEGKTVPQKLYSIFHGPNYVYKADVELVVKGEKRREKLIGYNHSNVITIDNQVIPIDDIEDVYFTS